MTNEERRIAWRKRYQSIGLAANVLAHHMRMRHGIDWNCRQIPRQFQLREGGPHYAIERGRIALSPQGFLPIKEQT